MIDNANLGQIVAILFCPLGSRHSSRSYHPVHSSFCDQRTSACNALNAVEQLERQVLKKNRSRWSISNKNTFLKCREENESQIFTSLQFITLTVRSDKSSIFYSNCRQSRFPSKNMMCRMMSLSSGKNKKGGHSLTKVVCSIMCRL